MKNRGMQLKPTENKVPSVDEDALKAFAGGSATDAAQPATPAQDKVAKIGRPKDKDRVLAIRRTYSMLPDDDAALTEAVTKAAKAGELRGKSDVVRAGIHLLNSMSEKQIAQAVAKVQRLK